VHETVVTLKNCYLSATESQTLTFGYRRYGRSTLATAGFFLFHNKSFDDFTIVPLLSKGLENVRSRYVYRHNIDKYDAHDTIIVGLSRKAGKDRKYPPTLGLCDFFLLCSPSGITIKV